MGGCSSNATNNLTSKKQKVWSLCKPLGFDLLLGMDVIKKLGGVHIDEGGKAYFAEAAHILGATIELEQPFVQSSTNAPNPGQYHGSGPVISHQKSYTTEREHTCFFKVRLFMALLLHLVNDSIDEWLTKGNNCWSRFLNFQILWQLVR